MFNNEDTLVKAFIALLRSGGSPWGEVQVVREFDYMRGRTDIVATTGSTTIAFEAKLVKWRRALDQAYRNTCFAQESYVLLPDQTCNLAMKSIGDFRMRGVGLCCISGGQIEILQESSRSEPIEPWLTAQIRVLALA